MKNFFLEDLNFSDLIITDEAPYYFLKNITSNDGLHSIPKEYIPVVQQIHQEIQTYDDINFVYSYNKTAYRVAKLKTTCGTCFFLRKAMKKILTLSDLTFPEVLIKKICNPKKIHGLLLFSGRMGTGKTTSASSFIVERLKKYGGHAITLEDPPELPLHGSWGEAGFCFQQNILSNQMTMAQGIVNAMRYSAPEIIYLGELREGKAVSQALRAAINGHLIVTTIHASGVLETLRRLLALSKQYDGEAANILLADGFLGVIHQQMVNDQGGKCRLKFNCLFAGGENSDAVRAKIRNNTLHQLSTEMQMQKNILYMNVQSQIQKIKSEGH